MAGLTWICTTVEANPKNIRFFSMDTDTWFAMTQSDREDFLWDAAANHRSTTIPCRAFVVPESIVPDAIKALQ